MYEKYIKRILDFVLSLIALIVLSPIILITAILVRIKLGSPVIFKQERPGKNEKIFTLYKFRTMTDKKDEHGNLLPDADRLTKFGKILRSTSLDELPELVNILKGDMAIVGPRPLVVRYLPYYTEEEHHRHNIRPGLTGLAQINGRNATGWNERFQYDLTYKNEITLINDIKIIIKTIKKVFIRENVLSGNAQILKSLDIERKEIIRQLTLQDIVQNEEIIKTYIRDLREKHYNGDIDAEVERVFANMKEYIENGTAIVLGLFILSKFNGFIWGYEIRENTIHVNYFFINANYRRFGFGRKMLDELKNSTHKNIELFVDIDNLSGLEFYIHNDFQRIEENEERIKLLCMRN